MKLAICGIIIALSIAIVVYPMQAREGLSEAQRLGRHHGRLDVDGEKCYWNGFWIGGSLGLFAGFKANKSRLYPVPRKRLLALEDKSGSYVAAYLSGYHVGYQERCNKIANKGVWLGILFWATFSAILEVIMLY